MSHHEQNALNQTTTSACALSKDDANVSNSIIDDVIEILPEMDSEAAVAATDNYGDDDDNDDLKRLE